MTSYGRAAVQLKEKQVAIEIKTLNSKFIDLRLKIPSNFNEKEMWLRKYLQEKLMRGKIEVSITLENQDGEESHQINRSVFIQYHNQLKAISLELDMPSNDLINAILRMPDIISTAEEPLTEERWEIIKKGIGQPVLKISAHRLEEGKSIETDLIKQIKLILEYLDKVKPFEVDRVQKVRQRMSNNLDDYLQRENVDENRFEQEVLFYLEKIDITEEKVRLRQHCDYFLQELADAESVKGRKLNFISQEIGREINTLGAKAYSSDIQKFVVLMKDALEKIKEQLANIV
jgi:uncharacterized protein (TIGR00255 family)